MRAIASTAALVFALALGTLGAVLPRVAHATPGKDACTGFLEHTAEHPPGTLVVDQPGVWCLDQDLVFDGEHYGSNFYMLRVYASDVTIDCRGHRIAFAGFLGQGYFTHAIFVTDNATRSTVRNCRIDNFSYGIFEDYASEYSTREFLIEDNVVTRNGLETVGGHAVGIYGYSGGTIRRNRIYDSAGWGIYGGTHATIVDNLVDGLVDLPFIPGIGIVLDQPRDVVVSRNVVRGLRHDPEIEPQELYGIRVEAIYGLQVKVAVSDNVLVGDGHPATIGIDCTAGAARVSDNVVAHFPTFHVGCVDLGDNDVSP